MQIPVRPFLLLREILQNFVNIDISEGISMSEILSVFG